MYFSLKLYLQHRVLMMSDFLLIDLQPPEMKVKTAQRSLLWDLSA